MKSKKLLLGSLSAMALVATPIATVVSCGGNGSAAVTYTELTKDQIANMKATLKDLPQAETNDVYIKYIQDQFIGLVAKDGKQLDLTSITSIQGQGKEDVAKILDAAKKIEAYSPAIKKSNTIVTVGSEKVDLGKVVAKDKLAEISTKSTVSTPGHAAKSAGTAVDVAEVTKVINAQTSKVDITMILAGLTDGAGVDIVTTTVIGATDVARAKTAALALITGAKFKVDVPLEPTVVTILGKNYPLKGFVASPTFMPATLGSEKEVAAKKKTIKFRAEILDEKTYKKTIKDQVMAWQLFADNKGKKLDFTKLDDKETTTYSDILKAANALLDAAKFTSLKK